MIMIKGKPNYAPKTHLHFLKLVPIRRLLFCCLIYGKNEENVNKDLIDDDYCFLSISK